MRPIDIIRGLTPRPYRKSGRSTDEKRKWWLGRGSRRPAVDLNKRDFIELKRAMRWLRANPDWYDGLIKPPAHIHSMLVRQRKHLEARGFGPQAA